MNKIGEPVPFSNLQFLLFKTHIKQLLYNGRDLFGQFRGKT